MTRMSCQLTADLIYSRCGGLSMGCNDAYSSGARSRRLELVAQPHEATTRQLQTGYTILKPIPGYSFNVDSLLVTPK